MNDFKVISSVFVLKVIKGSLLKKRFPIGRGEYCTRYGVYIL